MTLTLSRACSEFVVRGWDMRISEREREYESTVYMCARRVLVRLMRRKALI